MKFILASNSPRRKEILCAAGYDYNVCTGDFEEKSFSSDPIKTATEFAKGKAKNVFDSLNEKENVLVLGADTVVFLNGKILGKPVSEAHAKTMLKNLSGKTHSVVTGFALISKNFQTVGYDRTEVTFNELTDKAIDEYISCGLYKGKAGAYGIQDGFPLVKRYRGSLNNVIGLPTEKLYPLLNELLK